MTVPLIGIVTDRKAASYGAWVDIPTDAISHTYVAAIQEAGGAPVLFPSLDVHVDEPGRLLDLIDGLFLPGGRDLDASLYASEAHPSNDKPLRVRDELEIALTRGARERDIPVLGACRGMQVLNVALGGTLEQHLGDRARPHSAPRRVRHAHVASGRDPPRHAAERHHARAGVRHLVAPPPGRRRARRGTRRLGERARRRRRGDRVRRRRLLPRRAVASRGAARPRGHRADPRVHRRRPHAGEGEVRGAVVGAARCAGCGQGRVGRRGRSGYGRPRRLASPRSCACAT